MYICHTHTHTHHQPLNYNIVTPSGFYAQSSDVKFVSNIDNTFVLDVANDRVHSYKSEL